MPHGTNGHERSGADAAAAAHAHREPAAGRDRFRVVETLEELHRRFADMDEGQVATYIPELAKADPSLFGVSVATVDGRRWSVGDAEAPFTIQSISKPFMHGLALEASGRAVVAGRVGVEPTGDAFDSIIKLDGANRPHNPMVNAGAIAMTDLVPGATQSDRLNRMLATMGRYMGRPASVDVSTFVSERTTGDRNRAMGYLLSNFGILDGRVDDVLDLYFQQCSIVVSAEDLALMAATLANGGVNPMTGERALADHCIRDVLSVMLTCGMYDYAGEWTYTVGLPAKSGVSGGLIVVVPGQLGLAVYSPPLDGKGNSIRGVRVCECLGREFRWHMFDRLAGAAPGTAAIVQDGDRS